jgi:malate dehydrogenase
MSDMSLGRHEFTPYKGRRKVTVVGGGNVGATCAQVLAMRDYADVCSWTSSGAFQAGKPTSARWAPSRLRPRVTGSNGYETAGSDVVVITAGVPRKPGMSRDDLVPERRSQGRHREGRRGVASSILIVSNPLDAMCHGEERVRLPKGVSLGRLGSSTPRASDVHRVGDRRVCEGRRRVVLGGHGDQWSRSSAPRASAACPHETRAGGSHPIDGRRTPGRR